MKFWIIINSVCARVILVNSKESAKSVQLISLSLMGSVLAALSSPPTIKQPWNVSVRETSWWMKSEPVSNNAQELDKFTVMQRKNVSVLLD